MSSIDIPASTPSRIDEGNGPAIRADLHDTATALADPKASPVLIALDAFGVLRLEGADATAFLQGQVTADIASLVDGRASMGGYCTAKGRMLASFIALRDGDAHRLIMRANLLAALQKRLSMFVLRSKVKISSETDRVALIGLIGARAGELLAALDVAAPKTAFEAVRSSEGDIWLNLPGQRLLGLVALSRRDAIWNVLARDARPVDAHAWEWVDVQQGLPFIETATQDHLTPQMANLELIGGVSFQKGCYPGQEIVARTHHLGKVKRRMYRAHVDSESAPAPIAGDAIFGTDHGEQAIGLVVSAALAPSGGYDVLASMLSAAAQAGTVRLRAVDGPALKLESLPYPLS